MIFREFFQAATGREPYPYQERFAVAEALPELLNVPTGVGKTATAILGWLWRRRYAGVTIQRQTPRRLVYCLPMRVLVEQTRDSAQEWLKRLGLDNQIHVHLLMSGTDDDHWDEHPESDAILIGTQDMLLSRALNRGYGMSRYRWPMHFGLLSNDCLWVMDETQLMGVGLTTTAQLQGLRTKLSTYGVTHSLWMSATLDASPLNTVDHPEPDESYVRQGLEDDDRKNKHVKQRLSATKRLSKSLLVLNSESEKKYSKDLAGAIQKAHQPSSLTLVVVNRVARAQNVFKELQSQSRKVDAPADLALIHARFRPCDRRQNEAKLFSDSIPSAGRIVIATQAIEAGVDVSARTLFTELAPWSSMVQRFGRCNRGGEFPEADVIWIDVQPKDDKDKLALPYEAGEYAKSRSFLKGLTHVGPAALAGIRDERPATVVHTLRRKDLLDLWDTTPDLAGNDLDVSRFIREGDDTDMQFYWRAFEGQAPPLTLPAPHREELCSVGIGGAREFLKKAEISALTWNPLEKTWRVVRKEEVRAGQVLLLKPEQGGYHHERGWTGDALDKPAPHSPADPTPQEGMEDDRLGRKPIELTQHLCDVELAARELRDCVRHDSDGIPWDALIQAARWHDVGKAHPAFQRAMQNVAECTADSLWAKSGGSGRLDYQMPDHTRRRGFRHELASALAWLTHRRDVPDADLVAFLIAAHHGKVRASIRSLSNEKPPADETIRFARGLWDGDELPAVELGNGETVPAFALNLAPMSLGESEEYGASWLSRVLKLRDEYGPFRLSYLETLLRIADWRGSNVGDERNGR